MFLRQGDVRLGSVSRNSILILIAAIPLAGCQQGLFPNGTGKFYNNIHYSTPEIVRKTKEFIEFETTLTNDWTKDVCVFEGTGDIDEFENATTHSAPTYITDEEEFIHPDDIVEAYKGSYVEFSRVPPDDSISVRAKLILDDYAFRENRELNYPGKARRSELFVVITSISAINCAQIPFSTKVPSLWYIENVGSEYLTASPWSLPFTLE